MVGSVTIGADGRGLIPVSLAADAATEGTETLTVTVAGKSATITVNDTSLTPAPTPRAMTLSVNQDSGPDFTGTTVNDTYSALPTTLGTGDSLDGGSGSDTLNLTANLNGNVALAGFSLTSIENINVNIADGNAAAAETLTLNMANSGASAVTVSGLAATTRADGLVLNNLAAGSSLAMTNATNVNLNANFLAAATAGTADSVSVTLNGVASTAATDSILTVGNGFETLNIAATGSASSIDDIVSNSTRLNVTGDQNLTVRLALDASLATIDASAYTGRLNIVTANNVATQDVLVNGVDVHDITLTGGSGNDTIDVSAALADNEISVSAGAGDDIVVIGAALAAGTAALAQDTLNGGDGADILVYTSAGFGALTAATTVGVSNFETLRVSNALATTITAANVQATGIATVNLAAGGTGGVTMAAGSMNVTLGAALTGALTLTDTGTAITDSITLSNVATTAVDMADGNSLTVTGYETLNIVTTAVGDTSQDFNAIALTADTGGTTTVNFSGADRATVGIITAATINASGLTAQATGTTFDMTAAAASVTTITGSAGADVLRGDASSTINGGAGNDTIVGGTGNDVLNGDAGNDAITTDTGNDIVNGGDGNDVITFAGNLNGLDRVNGGDGTDTLSVTNASITALQALTISEANTFNSNFTNVETLSITDALDSTGDSFDLGYLNGITRVVLTTITGNQIINGFDSGETLELTAVEAERFTLGVNGALAGATDALTVVLSNNADADYGDVTIANVETVTINATQSTADAANSRVGTLGVELSQTAVTGGGSGAAQTLLVTGTESLTIDTAVAAATIDASGMSARLATTTGLTMTTGFTATTVIPGQTVTGSTGADTLIGSTGADSLNGGAGNDTLVGGLGADQINGGDGTDTFSTAGMVGAAIEGTGTGTSTGVVVNLSDAAITNVTVVNNGAQNLSSSMTSVAAGTASYLFGGVAPTNSAVTDTLISIENVTLAGNGANYVVGSSAANVIVGGTGVDYINGGAGNDTITGGVGADVLTGGLGADTFVMVTADRGDTIADFAVASDFIDFNTPLVAITAANTTPLFYQAAAGGVAIAAGTTVFELTGVTHAGAAGDLVTALGASATNGDFDAADSILIVTYLTGGGAQIWNFIDADGANIGVGELTLIATLTGVAADAMVAANFI